MPSRAPHPEQPLGGPVEQRDRLGRADPDHGVAQRGEDPDGARLGGPSCELRLLEGDAQRPDLLIELLDRTGDLAELTAGRSVSAARARWALWTSGRGASRAAGGPRAGTASPWPPRPAPA